MTKPLSRIAKTVVRHCTKLAEAPRKTFRFKGQARGALRNAVYYWPSKISNQDLALLFGISIDAIIVMATIERVIQRPI
jgi:hypothetical protein